MNKKYYITIILLLIVGLGYYAISPLFRNVEVNDALPENVAEESPETVDVPSGFEDLSALKQEEMLKEMEGANKNPMPLVNDSISEAADRVTFPVIGTLGHPASGQVSVLETTTGTIVRYEDFATINGPLLHVYLAKDLKAKDFVDLGVIKGTSGNINYVVPEGIQVSDYNYVMYWCVPFGVLFNYAEII